LPFEYWDKLDMGFINKLFIYLNAEGAERKRAMDSVKKKK